MTIEKPKKGADRKPNDGNGRPKGALNKENKALREMILAALNEQDGGGVEYLKKQAQETPASFMTLLGKVLPTQVHGAGDDGAHIVKIIELVALDHGEG